MRLQDRGGVGRVVLIEGRSSMNKRQLQRGVDGKKS
jgi:hypothetical protein